MLWDLHHHGPNSIAANNLYIALDPCRNRKPFYFLFFFGWALFPSLLSFMLVDQKIMSVSISFLLFFIAYLRPIVCELCM